MIDQFSTNQRGFILQNSDNREKMRTLLNKKGCGFCLAKWTQVTMHLGTGLTHSCHHPTPHKIPLEELKNNPGALHNTLHKKNARKQMLNNERPSECDYCWRIEDNTVEYSDRIIKSLDPYSITEYESIINYTGDEDVYPKYLEISFSNVCNFKCSYCNGNFSSKWAEEIKQHGPYILHDKYYNGVDEIQIKNNEDNPYTDAFWEWFPDALPHLHTLRITGGEPLLSKHTMKLVDYLIAHPNPNLEFAINTNGNVPDEIWKEFVIKIQTLVDNKVCRFTLFTSAESSGKQAEYSRYGMDWNKFKSNIEYFLDNTDDTRVVFMAAFNILSLTSFKDFLQYVLFLKRRYNKDVFLNWLHSNGLKIGSALNNPLGNYKTQNIARGIKTVDREKRQHRVGIDIPYVRQPEFLDANILSEELLQEYFLPAVEFMFKHTTNEFHGSLAFEAWEASKLKRIFTDCVSAVSKKHNAKSVRDRRIQFLQFVQEYDRRRNTNFIEAFPEMKNFLDICKMEKDSL
jgi:organic radical activating enzyme